jgi:hypothetical protein
MVYITGSKEQNALALKLVIQKVGGRSFGGEPKEEPLDPATEECLYIPSIAVTSVLSMASGSVDIQELLEKNGVSLRTSSCNAVETGLTTVRIILKGPEDGRAIVHSYLSDALARWRSAGGPSSGVEGIDPSHVSMNADAAVNKELETSLKLTIPNNMLSIVLGTDASIVEEIFRLTNASIRVTNQTSPSIECDLVVVVVTGLTAHIIKAQEILLVRMLNSKIPLPRLPVQLSNNINASSGGISSSLIQTNQLPTVATSSAPHVSVTSTSNAPRATLESASQQQLKQIEMQMQYLQLQRQNVLNGGSGSFGGIASSSNPPLNRQSQADARRAEPSSSILHPVISSGTPTVSVPQSNLSSMPYQRSNSSNLQSVMYSAQSNVSQQVYYVSSGNSQPAAQSDTSVLYAMVPMTYESSSQPPASSSSNAPGNMYMSSSQLDNNMAFSSNGQRQQSALAYAQNEGGLGGSEKFYVESLRGTRSSSASSNSVSAQAVTSSSMPMSMPGSSTVTARGARSGLSSSLVGVSSSGLSHAQPSHVGMAVAPPAEMDRNMKSSNVFNVVSAPYTVESTNMIDRFGNPGNGSISLAIPQQSQLDSGTTYYSRPVYQSQATILAPATVHGRPSPPSPTVVLVSPQASPLTGYGVPLGSFNDDFSMFTDPLYFGGQGAADMGSLGGGGVSYLMGYGPTGGFAGDDYAAAEATYARVFSPPSPSMPAGVPSTLNAFAQFSSATAEHPVEAINKKRVNTMSRSISKNLRNSENLGK